MEWIIADRFNKNVTHLVRNKDENGIIMSEENINIDVGVDWNGSDVEIINKVEKKIQQRELYKIIVWPEKVELEFVEEQTGLYKKVYRKADDKQRCYCEILGKWYT